MTQDHAGARVLVVDDSELTLLTLAAVLDHLGFAIETADCGLAGLAAAEQAPFDVLLLDVRMADLDGLALTRAIRNGDGPNREVPIIAVTGDCSPAQIQIQRAAGMTTHISKPFNITGLAAALSDAMALPRTAH